MNKPTNGADLASEILARSGCSVQVGAAITDSKGIFSWGWNSTGPSGYGQCAEAHAISRANRKRLEGALIYVAGTRRRNGKFVPSKPCNQCQKLINKFHLRVMWRTVEGDWVYEGG